MNYAKVSQTSRKATSPTSPIPGANQVKNSEGGYVFKVSRDQQVRRFLILGSAGGTYYASQKELTEKNSQEIISAIQEDGLSVVNLIKDISSRGLAKSNDPAIFALALVFTYGNLEVKRAAEAIFNDVIRIGTHLLHFVDYINTLNGWNRMLRRTVSSWYLTKSDEALEYQMVKYQSREGMSHHDALHFCHAKPSTPAKDVLFNWAKTKEIKEGLSARSGGHLEGYRMAHENQENPNKVAEIIQSHELTFEMLPTEVLRHPVVWEAMLPHLGYTALMRNLGRISSIGMTKAFSGTVSDIISSLTNEEKIKKSMVHPLGILIALKTYSMGRGIRGSMQWSPNAKIVDALDDAFYKAFVNVIPTNKRVLLALDVSGSMSSPISGGVIRCCEASAAMALVTAKTEKNYEIRGFSDNFIDLGITSRDSLASATTKAQRYNFGGTDCSLPMEWAIQNKIPEIGAFVVYTDSETYMGTRHPIQALKEYRNKFSPAAKLIVVGMNSNGFTIADPNDAGSLDVVGFDASAPAVMADFIRE